MKISKIARKPVEYVVAVDYDGTLFKGEWPDKGSPMTDVIRKLQEFARHGARIVLWTCREAKSLREAVERCREEGLEFDAVNENVDFVMKWVRDNRERNGGYFSARKIWANLYLDDKSPGSIEAFLKMDAKKVISSYSRD